MLFRETVAVCYKNHTQIHCVGRMQKFQCKADATLQLWLRFKLLESLHCQLYYFQQTKKDIAQLCVTFLSVNSHFLLANRCWMLDTGPWAGVITVSVPANEHCSGSMKGPCSNGISPLSSLPTRVQRASRMMKHEYTRCHQEVTGLARNASFPGDTKGIEIPLPPRYSYSTFCCFSTLDGGDLSAMINFYIVLSHTKKSQSFPTENIHAFHVSLVGLSAKKYHCRNNQFSCARGEKDVSKLRESKRDSSYTSRTRPVCCGKPHYDLLLINLLFRCVGETKVLLEPLPGAVSVRVKQVASLSAVLSSLALTARPPSD
jgi:hypothetical protein